MRDKTSRILAAGRTMSNDTWETGLNNNDAVIGPSGCGKTRGYVKPNILQCNESMVISDPKGRLRQETGRALKCAGYRIINIDLTDCPRSYGYSPLDYVSYDGFRGCYREQDIMRIAACIVPVEDHYNPFWDKGARMYLEAIIGYVLECLPEREHTMESVAKLFMEMGTPRFDKLFEELYELNPDSFAAARYRLQKGTDTAEKMFASYIGILAEKLSAVAFGAVGDMFRKKERIRFRDLRREKTAVFLTISDTDRSMDGLASLFYAQALHELCNGRPESFRFIRNPLPVRFIFDDFAANFTIPDFDRIISVIRSRDVYASVILQSLSQLEGMYGHAAALTILNNCDNLLYLGGQDVETARYVSLKADKPLSEILNMPLSDAWLFTRGRKPERVKKYELETHERYKDLPEALARDDVPFPDGCQERYGMD